jgi:hypothetical protein
MQSTAPENNSAPLRRVLYVATSRKPWSRQELAELLAKSRMNNTRDGITGLLLYREGIFIQALEGPTEAMRSLLGRIGGDLRIMSCDVIDDSPSYERIFPDWRMGFRNLDDPGIAAHPGFSDFMNLPRNAERTLPPDPTHYWRILDFYRKQL